MSVTFRPSRCLGCGTPMTVDDVPAVVEIARVEADETVPEDVAVYHCGVCGETFDSRQARQAEEQEA